MLSKKAQMLTLAAAFALGSTAIATAQNSGQGASTYAPGHSTTNTPPGQGGIKGDTWNPPGQLMNKDKETTGSNAAKSSSKDKSKRDDKMKAKGM